jgi:predicted MPP superfamily phosphohydrolase
MITRRHVLQTLGGGIASFLALGGYAVGIEAGERLVVTNYDLTPPRWPAGAKPLTVALIADIHAVDPWMSAERIGRIVEQTNRLAPDLVLLLGDYVGTIHWRNRILQPEEWAEPLGGLKAPLGTYAILGNHDWWWSGGPKPVRAALEKNNIQVLVNDVARIDRAGHRFWLTGTDSMVAIRRGRGKFGGRDDLSGTLAKVRDDAPVIHLAHEPDLFAAMPDRVSLTVSGHTHGGQIRLPILGAMVVPSQYGQRYAYGHVVENGRHLVVSGGLGCSLLPARFMMPPEIVYLKIRGGGTAGA